MLQDLSIKIKNYKSFSENEQGFEGIYPINLVIGRNNSGKSALIDLVAYGCGKFELADAGHKGKA
ncbi:MAG: AAA family ATPase, partial [Candidatus Omnitrophica bacterium]|nr:AAA family ATPase [Candidatus Omnitrophota bacterium]